MKHVTRRSFIKTASVSAAGAALLTSSQWTWSQSGPRKGGTFVWIAPYGISVDTLDPANTTDEKNLLVILNIHRGLYGWDAKNNIYKLELAERVTESNNGKTFTYTLRDAQFHNGRKITADDVVYTYNRLANPKNAMAAAHRIELIQGAKDVIDGKATEISGIKKIDDKTVEITFTGPIDPGFQLWSYQLSIVPKEEVEKGNFAFNPVGCGPFMFKSMVQGSEIVLIKNPNFYEKGKPYLDTLIYKIMPDAATRDMAFRARELDANLLFADQYATYRNDPKVKKNLLEVPEMFTRAMRFNPNFALKDGRKPFSDKRVRQAINFAIDNKIIVEKYAKGKAYPATGFLAPNTPGYDPSYVPYKYDPEKAKKLMTEAGYKDGFPIEILAGTSPEYGAGVIEAALPFLKKIKIDVKILKLENAVAYEKYSNGEFQAGLFSHTSGPDPLSTLQRFHSQNPRSMQLKEASLTFPELDSLVEQAAATSDKVKRTELLKKANKLITDEAMFWFYNYNKAVIIHQPWVKGMVPVCVEMMEQPMESVWIDESSPRSKG